MNDILCIVKTTSQIKNGSWVRVEHGIYPDDLAKVEYCDMIQNMVTFKLIPRIDYTKKNVKHQMIKMILSSAKLFDKKNDRLRRREDLNIRQCFIFRAESGRAKRDNEYKKKE
ncbi:unnamed protein product [Rotaria sp. Silwood1]|nr:unnamed protein product [Rotaria sp. Silwood1]